MTIIGKYFKKFQLPSFKILHEWRLAQHDLATKDFAMAMELGDIIDYRTPSDP